MCFDLDSHPPIPPVAGAAIDGQKIELHASDGARFVAFDAVASSASGAGIVIFPDVRGLHHFYEELALRFAERGIDAVAIDYFGRTAPSDDRDEGFEFMPHVEQTSYETLPLDAKAAVEHLTGRGVRSVFAMGFCFGGKLALLSAARPELGVAGAIGFYGWPVEASRGLPAPIDHVGETVAPILAIFGGADTGIPPAAAENYRAALEAAGVENEVVIYPGAPHGFFDRKAADFADASADAWQRVLDFVRRHTPAQT